MGQPVIALAHRLGSRELRLVFPLLADNGFYEPRAARFQEKLTLLIRERACLSLYQYGWTLYQQTFPAAAVARPLALLCRILEIKKKTAAPIAAARPAGRNRSGSAAGAGTGAGANTAIGGRCPPLISELADPDSRSFIRQLFRVMDKQGMSLDQLLKCYQIRSEWPLGAALIGQCFLNGETSQYEGGHRQFGQVLQQADPGLQADLLQRLFNLTDLSAQSRNKYFQAVYRQFGDPADGHPIWRQMKSRSVDGYRRWIIAATIGSHCRSEPAKARFYLRYAERIDRVETWDDDTLLLHFPGFVIADSKKQPLLALYYDQTEANEHPFGLAAVESNQNPASLTIPHRRVDDAIRRASSQGVVGLPFDEEGIRFSGVFLDFCLQGKSAGRNSWLHRKAARGAG